MPAFKQTPASINYLKAHANILKRPTFWAATSGLILSVFLLGEYLANPQQYTGNNDPDTATNSSGRNTSASNNEIVEAFPEASTVPAQTRVDWRSPGSAASKAPLLQEFLLDQSSTDAQKVKPGRSQSSAFSSSFSSETQRDRPSESQLPSLSSLKSPSSSGFPSPAATRNNASSSLNSSPTTNPLQSGLDRYSPNGMQSPPSPVRSFPQSSAENSQRDSRLSAPEDSFRQDSLGRQELSPQGSSPQGLSGSQFAPQLSPSPGTTGYTLPPTLRTSTPSVSPSSSNGNLQPIPGQIAPQTAPIVPGQPYNYSQPSSSGSGRSTAYPNVQPSLAPSSQPMPSPFSVPRSVPGRSIGGGQVNTFSNP